MWVCRIAISFLCLSISTVISSICFFHTSRLGIAVGSFSVGFPTLVGLVRSRLSAVGLLLTVTVTPVLLSISFVESSEGFRVLVASSGVPVSGVSPTLFVVDISSLL